MNPITGYVKYPEGEFLKNIRENYKDYYERNFILKEKVKMEDNEVKVEENFVTVEETPVTAVEAVVGEEKKSFDPSGATGFVLGALAVLAVQAVVKRGKKIADKIRDAKAAKKAAASGRYEWKEDPNGEPDDSAEK